MSFLKVNNVKVVGVAACVPRTIEDNRNYPYFAEGEADRVIESTGIKYRRIAPESITSSDLCYEAAEKMIANLQWNKAEIDCLIYVSQTPDYILPPTSCILQDRLGLSTNCFTLDSSVGCPGWIFGMATIASLLSHGQVRKGLLLVGETPSKYKSFKDKTAWPLFGDCGTATALEFSENTSALYFNLGTDGASYQAINIRDGGFRHPFSADSLIEKKGSDGIFRNALQSQMDGMNVFSFAIKRAPLCINELLSNFNIDKDCLDYIFIHQANMYMNEKIRKKIGVSAEKVPYSLRHFGNTSCASIPLTMVVGNRYKDMKEHCKNIACAFGVGLSWGSCYFETEDLIIPEIVEI